MQFLDMTCKQRRAIGFGLAAVFMSLCLSWTGAAGQEVPFLVSFVLGDYVIIGKEPDNGSEYSGLGRIEREGHTLLLHRRIGGRKLTAEGAVELPSPPGEGSVLRFRWHDGQPRIMTCLVHGDLDNHARLTCYWTAAGRNNLEPGLEAMFPTAAWPDTAPSKSFAPTAPHGLVH